MRVKPRLKCHMVRDSKQKLAKATTAIQNEKFVCALCDIVRIGPVLDTKTTHLAGLHSVEVLAPYYSSVLISRGLNQYATQILYVEQLQKKQSAFSL